MRVDREGFAKIILVAAATHHQYQKGEMAKVPGYSIVALPPERIQLIGVRTGKVEKDTLLISIRAVGIIEPDQTKLARLHTCISGWVTKVHVNFIGQHVKKGDPLLEIHSPDLLATGEGDRKTVRPGRGDPPLSEIISPVHGCRQPPKRSSIKRSASGGPHVPAA